MRRRPRLASAVTAIAALGLVCTVCIVHAHAFGAALDSVSVWTAVGAVALHVATLVLRTEAWRLTLGAAGGEALSPSVVHGANAAAFVAGTLQSQAALPARVALLSRLAGDHAPRPGQICVADVPIFALEMCATSALLSVAVLAGRGSWWIAPLALALALGVLLGARRAPERFADRPIVRGLAILGDRRRRITLVVLVATIAALTLVRVWLILAVCGLPHGLGEVAWVFAALGAFGVLPLGPGAPPSATVAAIGAANVGAAAAAGLLLSASGIIAVLAYALGVVIASRAHRRWPALEACSVRRRARRPRRSRRSRRPRLIAVEAIKCEGSRTAHHSEIRFVGIRSSLWFCRSLREKVRWKTNRRSEILEASIGRYGSSALRPAVFAAAEVVVIKEGPQAAATADLELPLETKS